jgi:hypothetical protein
LTGSASNNFSDVAVAALAGAAAVDSGDFLAGMGDVVGFVVVDTVDAAADDGLLDRVEESATELTAGGLTADADAGVPVSTRFAGAEMAAAGAATGAGTGDAILAPATSRTSDTPAPTAATFRLWIRAQFIRPRTSAIKQTTTPSNPTTAMAVPMETPVPVGKG